MRSVVALLVISLTLAILSGLIVWGFLMLMHHFGIAW